MSTIDKVNALTQEQRERALREARRRIAGPEPEAGREPILDDFLLRGSGKYPLGVTRMIRGLAIGMLIAAFLPSAMRMHEIGWTTFHKSIPDNSSTTVAAWSLVVMAEIGQVIFSLAAAVLPMADRATRINWQRLGLLAGALLCTLIALAGNGEVVKPWDGSNGGLFIWLETFAPPLLVLVTAQVLKTQMLHAIEDRHAAQGFYVQAHADWIADCDAQMRAWQDAYANAPTHSDWSRQAANALRDALRAANRRSTAVMRALTHEDWYALIHRELRADQWYTQVDTRMRETQAIEARMDTESVRTVTARAGASGGTHTGETAGQVDRVDGAWIAICPHCGERFEKDSERGATNALAAHVGRWCKVRNAESAAPSVNGHTPERTLHSHE